jgi:hypothetical protein
MRPRTLSGRGGTMRKAVVVAAVAAVAAVAVSLSAPALADEGGASDPKDEGQFDLARVAHGHSNRFEGWVKHTVRFHQGFTKKAYRQHGSLDLYFPDHDSSIDIQRKKDRWRATMRRDGEVVGHPRIWRPDGRSFRVLFPPRWLDEQVESYRWFAESIVWYPSCVDQPPPSPQAISAASSSCPVVYDRSETLKHTL